VWHGQPVEQEPDVRQAAPRAQRWFVVPQNLYYTHTHTHTHHMHAMVINLSLRSHTISTYNIIIIVYGWGRDTLATITYGHVGIRQFITTW
jgi:hypothetical protein